MGGYVGKEGENMINTVLGKRSFEEEEGYADVVTQYRPPHANY